MSGMSESPRLWQPVRPVFTSPLPLGDGGGCNEGAASPSASRWALYCNEIAPPSPLLRSPSPAADVECAPPSALHRSPSPAADVESAPPSALPQHLHARAAPTSSTSSISVPSPAVYLEFGSPSPSSSIQLPPTHRRPCQNLRDEEVADILNYGSDADSDESDEDLVVPTVPRASRAMMMPFGQDEDDEDAGEVGAGSAPAAAAAPTADCASSATDQPWSLFIFSGESFRFSRLQLSRGGKRFPKTMLVRQFHMLTHTKFSLPYGIGK